MATGNPDYSINMADSNTRFVETANTPKGPIKVGGVVSIKGCSYMTIEHIQVELDEYGETVWVTAKKGRKTRLFDIFDITRNYPHL